MLRGCAGLPDCAINARARTEKLEILDQVLDIFVDAEAAGGNRHVARIVPVGDEHVMLRQQRAHGRAQERREMAGERRHHENPRLRRRDVLLEVQKRPERSAHCRLFPYLDFAVADGDM
jgi:hypothetical protein